MNKIERVTKPLVWQMTILMTAILAGCGGGSSTSAPAAPVSSALGATASPSIAVSTAVSGVKATSYSIEPSTPSITVSGIYPKLVSPVLTGSGFINVVNNANAHVAATQTGAGTVSIVNNGAVLAATNSGKGAMTINNAAIACAVAVTNVGNGNITVTAASTDCPAPVGTKTFALTYTDGLDHIYPAAATAFGSSLGASTNNPNIHVSGTNAGNVTSVLTDPTNVGTITVVNAGAHVAATQTGAGSINATNSVGVLAATNTGTGVMIINNTDTGAVAVTRTGNGNTTVTASGTTPLKLSFHGDGDVVYPLTSALGITSSLGTVANTNISVSGLYAINVTPVLKGDGSINVVNNVPQHVAATEVGTGAINIVNSGIGSVLTATNTGNGVMTINSTATAAVTVTNTYVAGHGSPANNITVTASGGIPITCTFSDGIDHNVIGNASFAACGLDATVPAALGSSLGAIAIGSLITGVTVDGSNMGAVTTTINDPTGHATIAVHNNGSGFDTATVTGTGSIVISNTGAGVTATNNGIGAMVINSTDTADVTVTNNGNGKVTVTASGSDPITLTHTGDDDFVYPAVGTALIAGATGLGTALGGPASTPNVFVYGDNAGAVTATIVDPTFVGLINVTNNGAAVTATETGTGVINVINNGAGVTATNTGNGMMTITSTDTAAVTVSNTGNGNIIVTATGSSPITLTYTDGLDHTYP